MKKVIKLTENDIERLVNKIINEDDSGLVLSIFDDIEDDLMEIPESMHEEYLMTLIKYCENKLNR